jgi:hypothetical protein
MGGGKELTVDSLVLDLCAPPLFIKRNVELQVTNDGKGSGSGT